MKIVITTGGTSEPIDKIRKITNSGTGKLGALIATKLLQNGPENEIFYICAHKSIKPEYEASVSSEKEILHIVEIESTMELKAAVENVLLNNEIDYFIHSMAVSDYMIDYVSTASKLAYELSNSDDFENTLKNASNILDNSDKLSSSEDNLIIKLTQTPKIIRLIKTLSPKTHLIGFKLLENVEKSYLIEIARKLLNKNKCDFVVANDLKNIRNGNHKAFIVTENTIKECNGKDDIANNIIDKIGGN